MEPIVRYGLLTLFCFALPCTSHADELQDSVSRFRAKLKIEDAQGVPDPYAFLKSTPEFAGLRRVRAVLPGLVYRGGADNKKTSGPKPNENPLTETGQENLCRASFGHGFYLYSTNYAKAKPLRSCQADGHDNKFSYLQKSVLLHKSAVDTILKTVHEAIISADHRPIYLHCWNGWHASGYISAIVIRQFCNVGADDAVAYWDRTADSPEKYQKIRDRLRAFSPLTTLTISEEQRAMVCPHL